MKKREIIALLNYQKSLEDSKHLNIAMKPYICHDGTILKPSNEYLKELKLHYGKLSEHLHYQANNLDQIKSISCTHPVLFFVDREYEKNYRCIICGQNIENPDILINWEKTVEIEETATSENHYRPLNSFYEIYRYIIKMIEDKDDDEEIDFKLYFPDSPINNNFKKTMLKKHVEYR